jgi:flavin-dependent dehydrogenase
MIAGAPLRVAIVGAGPAGSTLAILLARRGADVTLFDDDRRPHLLVGESLVPAAIPILRALGLEGEMASFSRVKPGVSFIWSPGERYRFTFARFAPAVFPYAYNVPRPRFDDVLAAHAVKAGVTLVHARARVEAAPRGSDRELVLAPETIGIAPSLRGRQPDLLVDATGRSRLFTRVLGIPAIQGPRKDVAHFAHFEGIGWDDDEPEGQVLIRRTEAGWIWCIPLERRLSVGIVVGHEAAARLGGSPEERLAQAIAKDPWLQPLAAEATRMTPVATYTNYQQISRRGCGPGWVAVGDALGFVDPMLSPGVFLSLRSAELVAEALTPALERRTSRSPDALSGLLRSRITAQRCALSAWMSLIAMFYDGRMLALMRAGRGWMDGGSGPFKQTMQDHIERHIALQATGAATTARYGRILLAVLGRYGLRGVEPVEMAIR